MLDWFACLLAPRLPSLLEQASPDLPEPSAAPELAARGAAALAAVAGVPFEPRGCTDPYRLLLGMGCRDLVTREADQNPDTAGRTPNYRGLPFEPVELPLGDGRPTLTGHRSTGAPGAPVVIVVHGLFDSHVSGYVVELAESLRRMGFHVVALDVRDHGRLRGQPPPPSLGLHEGRDLFQAARILSRAEGVSVGLLGLSYGAHCVVRAAHEATAAGEPEVLRGGVMAICGPLDVAEGVLAFDDPARLPKPESPMQRVIFWGLLSTMARHLRIRLAEQGVKDRRGAVYEKYVRDVVMPRLEGIPGLMGAFLAQARSAQAGIMDTLAVPTFLLHAVDDPLVPVEHLRKGMACAAGNPLVGGRELAGGGHVGLAAVDPEGTLELLAQWFGSLRDG
jgi:predicted alpha/beta-fold hydrolase